MHQIILLDSQPVRYEIVFCSGECLDDVPSLSPDVKVVDGFTGHLSSSWENLKWDREGMVERNNPVGINNSGAPLYWALKYCVT